MNTRTSTPSNCIKISTDTKMSKQTVTLLHLANACYILNKVDEFSSIVEINGPYIICIRFDLRKIVKKPARGKNILTR